MAILMWPPSCGPRFASAWDPMTAAPPVAARTVGELRARAEAIRLARERVIAEKAAAERKRQAEEAEKVRRARLDRYRAAG